MRYGIISDIHANLEALEVGLDFLKGVDMIFCAGDIIGYGPNPNECCDIIRESDIPTCLGNHDGGAIGKTSIDRFSRMAREAIAWTVAELSAANRLFLQTLPLARHSAGFVMVHGSLSNPAQFEYVTSPYEARNTFPEMGSDKVCFIGHTHVTEFYSQRVGETGANQIAMTEGGIVELNPEFLYIVNCGSVGQPRDGDPRASIGIFDTDSQTVEIHRLDYPLQITQEKIQRAGLLAPLWTRLQYGM